MRTISPGSTSRTYVAPIASNAHVSLATHHCPSAVCPSASGRMPHGSRQASMRSGNRNNRLNAPCKCLSTCGIGSCFSTCDGLASRWTMISVSVVLWKMCPCFSYSVRSSRGVDQIAVVRHRHRAHRILPQAAAGRCTVCCDPVVEYRTCPIAALPARSSCRCRGLKTCDTSPIAGVAVRSPVHPQTAMPADSCPRCCCANRPW